MKQIAKLKDEARKYEQREEWDRAIQAYSEVLRLGEAGDGAELDLPLYNRVGDLYVRLGRAAEAVKYYEQAADKYAEAGLYNNAIALCNKALRYDAGRVELLKKLGQFSASQGFFTDARRWYLEYCERMSKRGAIDQAFQALTELADVHDDPEIRELLARQLKDHNHPDRAIDEYRRAYALRMSRGETGEADAIRAEIQELDPNASLEVEPQRAAGGGQASIYDELPGFLDEPAQPEVGFDGPVETTTLDTGTIEIETAPTSFDEAPAGADYGTIDFEPPMSTPADALDDLMPFDIGIEPSLEFKPPVEEPSEEIQTDAVEEALPDAAGEQLFTLPDLEEIDVTLPGFEEEEITEEDAEPLPGWDEEGAEAVVDEGESLPLIEPDFEAPAPTERDEWPRFELEESAAAVAEPLMPEETAPFTPPPIFEIEPLEAPADEAEPPAPPTPAKPKPDYVDLGAFLLDEPDLADSTRFVVAEKAPTGDEERDFADMLQQFKAKVAEVIPKEDAGSHYDLGLAFKEMGLIDEAIAEFQTALRGGEEKLKVYEELGNCFVQKRQYSVAITILNRAMQMPHGDEGELLGVYYNLGRAHEELGQHSEARTAYERIISVDIGFQDTSERLAKL